MQFNKDYMASDKLKIELSANQKSYLKSVLSYSDFNMLIFRSYFKGLVKFFITMQLFYFMDHFSVLKPYRIQKRYFFPTIQYESST